MSLLHTIKEVVNFLSDLVTIVLGAIALWGIFFHKKELSLLLRALVNNNLNERVKRIKETLGKLESLSYDNKPARPEIFALLGQIIGQVKPLCGEGDGALIRICSEITATLESKKLTEAGKRKILYELHGALDNASFEGTLKIVETKK